jgi:hypothetical protein
MSDISAFPDLIDGSDIGDECIIQTADGPAKKFTLAANVTAGQVVVFHATDGYVTPATGATTERVAGVVEEDGTSGDEILVYLAGNIAYLVNADDTTTIDMGAWVITNDNAVKGTISAVSTTASGTTATLYLNTVGIALEDIDGDGFGKVLIMPVPITVANAS